jgi:hypothetical protein
MALTAKRLLLMGGAMSLSRLIAAMFRNGELGTAQFPQTLASLYQGGDGVTPVAAATNTVGLSLDTRYSLARGPELWVDASVGLTGEATRISPNVYRILSSAGVLSSAGIVSGLTAGKSYEYSYTVDSVAVAGGGITSDAVASTAPVITTTGAKRYIIEASGVSMSIKRAASATDIQVSGVSVREVLGSHGRQVTVANRPLYQTGPARLVADGVNDVLVTKFPSSLGAACTIARSVPGVGASILTAQTVGTSYSDTESHAGLVIVNRALTTAETSRLTSFLDGLAVTVVTGVLADSFGFFLVDSLGNYLVA